MKNKILLFSRKIKYKTLIEKSSNANLLELYLQDEEGACYILTKNKLLYCSRIFSVNDLEWNCIYFYGTL